jgi:hypothetical protein
MVGFAEGGHKMLLSEEITKTRRERTMPARRAILHEHDDCIRSFFQRYAHAGENDKLKDWASKTLPVLQRHLEMAKQLDGQPGR